MLEHATTCDANKPQIDYENFVFQNLTLSIRIFYPSSPKLNKDKSTFSASGENPLKIAFLYWRSMLIFSVKIGHVLKLMLGIR